METNLSKIKDITTKMKSIYKEIEALCSILGDTSNNGIIPDDELLKYIQITTKMLNNIIIKKVPNYSLNQHITNTFEKDIPKNSITYSKEPINVEHNKNYIKNWICCKCNKSYAHQSGLSKHKRKCSSKLSVVVNKEQINSFGLIDTTEIKLKSFGNENIEYIDNNYCKQLIKNISNMFDMENENTYVQEITAEPFLSDLVDKIWLNAEHPENHNIRIKNTTRGECFVFNGNKFIEITKQKLFATIGKQCKLFLRKYVMNNQFASDMDVGLSLLTNPQYRNQHLFKNITQGIYLKLKG